MADDIRSPEFRHVRAEQLHTLLAQLHAATRAADFRDDIVVRPDGAYVNIDGILLEALSQRYYLKASGAPQRGIARPMNDVLVRHGIRPANIVDVGANYGEVSLWFAREYPHARILAVEPVRANCEVFEKNLAAQSFSTSRIELLSVAVMDRTGEVNITSGVSTMNRVVEAGLEGTEPVPCDRLENIMARDGMHGADFVKVDIEGAEPYLEDSVYELGKRVKCWMFEFSKFSPLAGYMDLALALLDSGFEAYQEDGSTRLPGIDSLEKHLVQTLSPKEVMVTNLWFFAKP